MGIVQMVDITQDSLFPVLQEKKNNEFSAGIGRNSPHTASVKNFKDISDAVNRIVNFRNWVIDSDLTTTEGQLDALEGAFYFASPAYLLDQYILFSACPSVDSEYSGLSRMEDGVIYPSGISYDTLVETVKNSKVGLSTLLSERFEEDE